MQNIGDKWGQMGTVTYYFTLNHRILYLLFHIIRVFKLSANG